MKKYITKIIKAIPKKVKNKGFFGGEEIQDSLYWIDIEQLSKDLEDTLNNLDNNGYEVMSIINIERGESVSRQEGGAGFSLTDGILITAKEKEN